MASQAIGRIVAFSPDAKEADKAVTRIFAVLDRIPKIKLDEGMVPSESFSGRIVFKNLQFKYPTRSEVEVLKNFSCVIESGMRIALVGQSGCGKSTVLQLIQRFYDSTNQGLESGIFFGDTNIKQLSPMWIRKQIGVVSQEPILFDITLRDNIAFGDTSREVPMDEIIEAAKKANIHEFILSLPEGYETRAGQGGSQLSGGQKQRIAIARALIRKPPVLLLDEATSALDSENERIVQDALDVAMVSRTSLVVAHRMSAVENADFVIVLSNGCIVESGAPRDLMKSKGEFYRLYRSGHY